MEEERRVFTCGVKWGYYVPAFTKICLDANIAILGSYNRGIETFRAAKKGDLIALKHGHNLIAIGEFQFRQEINQYWEDVLKSIDKSDEKIKNLADKYKFGLEDEIDVVDVVEWFELSPTIYYPTNQAAIQIRDTNVIKACMLGLKNGKSYKTDEVQEQSRNDTNSDIDYANRGSEYFNKGDNNNAIKDYQKALESDLESVDKDIAYFIFKYISLVFKEGFNLDYLINKLLDISDLWKDEIYKNNDNIKSLVIYEHILLYFLSLKETDKVVNVAYYTSTVVLGKLIKDKSSMRMSTLSKVNDPEEGKVLIKMLSEHTEKHIKEESIRKEDCAVQTSFTRCTDSLTMFRLYGKNEDKEGTGVSLVFNKDFFDTTFEYNKLPTSPNTDFEREKYKQPLYYVLYYDEEEKELIFNPYKSNYKNIIINLKNEYNDFEYSENFSFTNNDDYEKVKINIGYILKKIFDIINKLDDKDVQNGYKALQNIKYLIKNSAFVEEQELRILKILDYNKLEVDYNIKSVYKDYSKVVSDNVLKKIILGPKIDNVYSIAETWRVDIKKESEKDEKYDDIKVLISKAPFN